MAPLPPCEKWKLTSVILLRELSEDELSKVIRTDPCVWGVYTDISFVVFNNSQITDRNSVLADQVA